MTMGRGRHVSSWVPEGGRGRLLLRLAGARAVAAAAVGAAAEGGGSQGAWRSLLAPDLYGPLTLQDLGVW